MKRVYGENSTLDGIVNPRLYAGAPIKILWLLRETWVEGDPLDLVRGEHVYERIGNSNTLHPMVYVTYSAFKQFPLWEEMSYIRDSPEMAEVLRSIAYINVKKMKGHSGSNMGDIRDWFKRGEHILKAQFAECQPEVVIGCAPYMADVFAWESQSSPVQHGIIRYVADEGKPLLIEAPHPSFRGRRKVYVDTITEVIRDHGPSHHSKQN